jgi:hypothetical protein
MRQQKTRLQAEVRRLVSAVAESGHSKSLLEEIGRKEDELQGIADRLLSATPVTGCPGCLHNYAP